jgi:hypothetical protein
MNCDLRIVGIHNPFFYSQLMQYKPRSFVSSHQNEMKQNAAICPEMNQAELT